MTTSVRKLGFWSSIGLTASGYLYAASYVAFALIFPVRPWRSMEDFASYYHGGYSALYTFIQACAFAISLFMLLFAAASCFHYAIQWTSVRAGIQTGNLAGLEMFAMQNFDSPLSMLNATAWTLFLGISNLAFAACFAEARRRKAVRAGFLINGASCLLAFVLYTLGVKLAMFAWTFVLTATWYVYPLLIKQFRDAKETGSI